MGQHPETKIVQTILKHIKGVGGDGHHVHGSLFQRAGEPDIDASYPKTGGGWHHLKIEVKTETGRATRLQLYRLKEYAERGYVAGIVRSVDDLKELITEREQNELG